LTGRGRGPNRSEPFSLATLLADAGAIATALEPAVAGALDDGAAPGRVEGIGWATVELDRAATELATALGLVDRTAFAPSAEASWLGAFTRRARPPGGPWIALLEPSREGRLAAFLARHGEGVAAVYVSRGGGGPAPPWLARGPLGGERWLAGERWGPWLIQVERQEERREARSTAPEPAVPSGE
jgi:hypothetical protein